jgi:hypothetical protein
MSDDEHTYSIRLHRRSWIGRAVRVPALIIRHRRMGIPWIAAIRLALVILK